MKTALVISGGGCKGAFAIGAIQWLIDLGLHFDIIVGTSTGALIAPLVGTGKFSVAYDIYSNVTTRQIIKPYCWLTLPWRPSIYSDKGLRKIINRNYTPEVHEKLNSGATEIRVCTVSLNTGDVCYWDPKQVDRATFMRALSASSNQPGLMPSVQVLSGEDYHVDGGVREVAPIQKAIELGAKRVIAIVLEREQISMAPGKFTRIPKVLLRTLSLMIAETRNNDIDVARRIPSIDLTIIRPKTHLTDNDLEFNPEVMRKMIKQGNRRASEIMPTV